MIHVREFQDSRFLTRNKCSSQLWVCLFPAATTHCISGSASPLLEGRQGPCSPVRPSEKSRQPNARVKHLPLQLFLFLFGELLGQSQFWSLGPQGQWERQKEPETCCFVVESTFPEA